MAGPAGVPSGAVKRNRRSGAGQGPGSARRERQVCGKSRAKSPARTAGRLARSAGSGRFAARHAALIRSAVRFRPHEPEGTPAGLVAMEQRQTGIATRRRTEARCHSSARRYRASASVCTGSARHRFQSPSERGCRRQPTGHQNHHDHRRSKARRALVRKQLAIQISLPRDRKATASTHRVGGDHTPGSSRTRRHHPHICLQERTEHDGPAAQRQMMHGLQPSTSSTRKQKAGCRENTAIKREMSLTPDARPRIARRGIERPGLRATAHQPPRPTTLIAVYCRAS